MSYDIELINKETKEVAKMEHPQYIRGGTVPAKMNMETCRLEHDIQVEARINITYNYSRYYYEATEGDERFAHDEVSAYYADGTTGPIETQYGIRGLYGKTPSESIPMLMSMIINIENKYKNEKGEWIETERKKVAYFKNGVELDNPISEILHGEYLDRKEEKYMISEGDTSDYWQATAANAIKPLLDMLVMATDNLLEKDVIWSGD